MSLSDVGGILRGLSSQVSVVRLTAEEEARVRELVKELQQILDAALKKMKMKIA
jgi:hypothetical protein